MIWLLQLEIMKLFHCLQVSLDRDHWTNLRNPGTLVSSVCDYNRLFPKMELEVLWVWEHLSARVQFCLQTSQPCTINSGPITAKYFVGDPPFLPRSSEHNSSLTALCPARFLFLSKPVREGPTKPSKAQGHFKETWRIPLKTVWHSSNSTASCTLISLFSTLKLKLHSVQLIALKVRFFSSRKLSKITLLFCLQLLFINASTWGSSQLKIEVYKDTRHTKIWCNWTLLATILKPWRSSKTPFCFQKYPKALVYSV